MNAKHFTFSVYANKVLFSVKAFVFDTLPKTKV